MKLLALTTSVLSIAKPDKGLSKTMNENRETVQSHRCAYALIWI